jgi:isoquinoline 1-oxidoreductase subunit alpha
MITITVNGQHHDVNADPNMPLLWVIRDILGLTGTKYGCGAAQCGACTVHLNGEAVRSCVTKLSRAAGQNIVTIEGLSTNNNHPLQLAWNEMNVPQCGYCQSGQLMSAAVLLRENPNPTDQDIDDAMSGNICRCGTYQRVRAAIHKAAEMQMEGAKI